MPDRDTPLALIRDTLAYLKDPLLPKHSPLAAKEECAFLQRKNLVTLEKVKDSHSQLVKGSLASSDSGSKNCVTLPSPTVVSRVHLETAVRDGKVAQDTDGLTQNLDSQCLHASASAETQIKKMLQRIAPMIQLTDQIPDDAKAKRVSNAWKERIPDAEVVLFACDSENHTLDLLKALAKAIDQHLAKPKILMAEKFEKEKRWDLFLEKTPLRLIIATAGIEKFPDLMRFYKGSTLNETPLLVLSPASVYKSLEQKALLWKTLCQMLKK